MGTLQLSLEPVLLVAEGVGMTDVEVDCLVGESREEPEGPACCRRDLKLGRGSRIISKALLDDLTERGDRVRGRWKRPLL